MFIIALPVQVWAGWQFYAATWKTAAPPRGADMNTLIALGTTAAFVYSTVATFWPSLFAAPTWRTTTCSATGRPSTSRRR